MPGTVTSASVEVTNVSRHGLWVLLEDRELFLAFDDFPWFRRATLEQVLDVELPNAHHLYWPALDVDLTLESIENPGKFPLIAR